MANDPTEWINGAVLPKLDAALCYRTFAGDAYRRVREITQKTLASALVFGPSSVNDLKNPAIDRWLARALGTGTGRDHHQRVKIMRLVWDALGSEFASRHELYELTYAGNHEEIRLHQLRTAQQSGLIDQLTGLVDTCMADYDEEGWTSSIWLQGAVP